MASNLDTDKRTVPDFESWESPETRIRWERGLAIVAGMIGVVLTFFFVMSVLPFAASDEPAPLTGQATVRASVQGTAAPAAQATPAAATQAAQANQGAALPGTSRAIPNVRRAPDLTAQIVRQLSQGQKVDVIGRSTDNQWLQILNPDNRAEKLWVSADMLDVSGDPKTLPEAR